MRRHRIGVEDAVASGPAIFAIGPKEFPVAANVLSHAVTQWAKSTIRGQRAIRTSGPARVKIAAANRR
jgi:hypothetical protein